MWASAPTQAVRVVHVLTCAEGRRGRCLHRPGRAGRIYGNLRRIRAISRADVGISPYEGCVRRICTDSARERSKKTEAVSAMQTQPAVCIARGGTKRQNKKPCFARLRFVSFDSDEGPGEIGIPRAPLSLPYFLSRRSEKESMIRSPPFGEAKRNDE